MVGSVPWAGERVSKPWFAALRRVRRFRRLFKPRLWRLLFWLRLADPDKIIGSYERTRLGVTETVEVTRRTDKTAAQFILPPNEWTPEQRDNAIARGQELAKEYDW